MMGRGRRRLAVPLACLLLLGGCGGSELDDVVRGLAHSQGVDESTVKLALERESSSQQQQLTLAREWRTELPDQPLPDLGTTLDDLARYGREQLESATCDALVDIARTGQVPSGQDFVEDYLSGLVTGGMAMQEVRDVAERFDELWQEASAGTLTSTDVRLELMRIQYC